MLADVSRNFQRLQREIREDLNLRRNEELASLQERANKVIQQIAEAEKFDLVVQEAVGTAAEDFRLVDLVGKPQSLSQFRGKVVLVNFWATWCKPCEQEMPAMQRGRESIRRRRSEPTNWQSSLSPSRRNNGRRKFWPCVSDWKSAKIFSIKNSWSWKINSRPSRIRRKK